MEHHSSQLTLGDCSQHNVVVLASLLALFILTSQEKKWVLALPFILFIGYLSRPDFSLVIIAVLAYQAITDEERAIQVAAMLAILMVAFFTWSYLGYGDILPPYYRSSRLGLTDFGEHLMGQMFSPNRGLFVYNPIFLLSIWGECWPSGAISLSSGFIG